MKRKNLIFIAVLAVICLVSGGYATKTALEYRAEAQVYEMAQETFVTIPETEIPLVSFPAETLELAEPIASQLFDMEEPVALEEALVLEPGIQVDFSALKQVNEDVVGWIYLPDTTINYPIMQGTSNASYLYTAYDGSYSASGSLFLDYRVEDGFTAQNAVVYGHNIGNGTMFQPLMEYQSCEFYEENPGFWILTEDGDLYYDICYVLVTSATSRVYDLTFEQTNAMADHLVYLASQSLYFTGEAATDQDLLVTLSTCTGVNHDQRLVVVAKQRVVD